MSKGLVSIVIPTYNRARLLCRTLDSVLAQTHSDWEAIVIDDGSCDNTSKVIAERYSDEARIRYIYQPNEGVCSARNHGLALVQGDYVAFLDSDDTWESWKLELQIACLRQNPEIGMVWTDMTAVDENEVVRHPAYLKTMYRSWREFESSNLFENSQPIDEIAPTLKNVVPGAQFSTGDIFSQMVTGNLVHTSTVLLTRKRQQEVGGFNPMLAPSGEDFEYHLRTCRLGRVGFVDVSSVRYQIGAADQLTARKYSIRIAEHYLNTIRLVIEQERDRILLPNGTLNRTLSYAHGWYGQELVLAGRAAEGRCHLSTALRHRLNPQAIGFFAFSLLPQGMREGLRNARKKWISPALDPQPISLERPTQ